MFAVHLMFGLSENSSTENALTKPDVSAQTQQRFQALGSNPDPRWERENFKLPQMANQGHRHILSSYHELMGGSVFRQGSREHLSRLKTQDWKLQLLTLPLRFVCIACLSYCLLQTRIFRAYGQTNLQVWAKVHVQNFASGALHVCCAVEWRVLNKQYQRKRLTTNPEWF